MGYGESLSQQAARLEQAKIVDSASAAESGAVLLVDESDRWADVDMTDLTWQNAGKCRNVDPDVYYVKGATQNDVARYCRDCPVIQQCGMYALVNQEAYGVWGGMTERERRVVLKKYPELFTQ